MNEPIVDFNEPESNQLVTLVEESKLPESKAKYILNRFQDYFTMADEWTKTTRVIKVTDASQTHMMDMARAARLAIREKRLAVEKSRKELKADVVREGKAIDGIANVLFALLEPLEEYYSAQENFVERQAAAKAKLIEQEVQERLDQEFEEEQAAKKEEDARIRAENEKLKQEAKEREDALKKAQDDLQAKKDEEASIAQAKLNKEEDLKKAGDSVKVQILMQSIIEIGMPVGLQNKDCQIGVRSVMQLLAQSVDILKLLIKEEVDF